MAHLILAPLPMCQKGYQMLLTLECEEGHMGVGWGLETSSGFLKALAPEKSQL